MFRHYLPALLGALLLGAAIFGSAQLAGVKKLRASLAGLDEERAGLREQVADLKKLNAELASRLDRGTPAAGPADSPETATGGALVAARSADGPGNGFRGDNARLAALMNSPEVQQLMALQQKAGLDGRYAALFRKLNLSPADLEKFKQLLVEKQSAVGDVMAAVRTQGLAGRGSRDEIRQLVQSTQAEIDASIRSALGEAVYAEYRNYETTLPQRQVTTQLEQRLSYSPTPLTPTQADQLVQILHNGAQAQIDRTAAANTVAVVAATGAALEFQRFAGGGTTRITNQAITQAQGVLSAPQLAALQSLQQEQQAAAQLAQQLRATRNERQPEARADPPRR